MIIAILLFLIVAPVAVMGPADLATLRARWGLALLAFLWGCAAVFVAVITSFRMLSTEGIAEGTVRDLMIGGAILILATPAGMSTALLAGLTGGNVMLARALGLASLVPIMFLLPILFGLPPFFALLAAAVLLVPLAVLILRPGLTARLSGPISSLSAILTLGLAAVVVWQTGLSGFGAALVTAVLLLAALAGIGWLLGAVLRLDQASRRAVSLALVVRHLGLPLAIVVGMDLPQMGVPIVLYGVLMWLWGLAPLAMARRAA